MPVRIQRKRTKGWRMPEGAVYVGRPTKWGNPYAAIAGDRQAAVNCYRKEIEAYLDGTFDGGRAEKVRAGLAELRGKDLACWCRLDQICHADVLLELANRGEE